MVGLALEAARFFKYLLILVEYSLAMTLFVCPSLRSDDCALIIIPELPTGLHLPTRWNSDPPIITLQPLPDDLCWVRRRHNPSQRISLKQPYRFFVNIGQIPPVLRWLRYFSTLGYTLEALSVNEVGSGLMIIVSATGGTNHRI